MIILIRWDATMGRWVLRVSERDKGDGGNPAPAGPKPPSKERLDPPHPQPPRMKAGTLAQLLLLAPARVEEVKEHAMTLGKPDLDRVIRFVERAQYSGEVVLTADQWDVLEALRGRLDFLVGDPPGGEG